MMVTRLVVYVTNDKRWGELIKFERESEELLEAILDMNSDAVSKQIEKIHTEYVASYPALVVELKWKKSAQTAIQQIKEKKYPESLLQYTGDILLVGINYDPDSKKHECMIEEYEKD